MLSSIDLHDQWVWSAEGACFREEVSFQYENTYREQLGAHTLPLMDGALFASSARVFRSPPCRERERWKEGGGEKGIKCKHVRTAVIWIEFSLFEEWHGCLALGFTRLWPRVYLYLVGQLIDRDESHPCLDLMTHACSSIKKQFILHPRALSPFLIHIID